MNVQVRIQFESPTEDDWQAMRSIANRLTDDPASVRVSAEANPEWLVAEFTMPTEAQYLAVSKVDSAIRYEADNRRDSVIRFPRTEAERERAERKAAARKARRKREK